MSWFTGQIEWTPETDRFRTMLEQMAGSAFESRPLMAEISDDVFSELAEGALDDAEPLQEQTLARKERAAGKGPRGKQKNPRPRKTEGRRVSRSTKLMGGGRKGLRAALTESFDTKSPVARREIINDQLVWGTKRWVTYAHPHIYGTSRGLPARLEVLQPGPFASASADRIKDILASHVAAKLESAGAPYSWIQEILEGRA